VDLEPEDEVEMMDEVRLRAAEAIERADDLIAAPRYGAESAAEYEKLARERAEPFVTKRAPEVVRKVRTQEPAPAAAPADRTPFVRAGMLEDLLRKIIQIERRKTEDQIAAALAGANARIVDLESRLARAESRVADVESKRAKK
jgi:predicted ATPase